MTTDTRPAPDEGLMQSMEPRKILIADDEKFALRLLRDLLEPCSWVIEEVSDGLEVLAAALRFKPDLVLLDLVMPGLGGLEVCRMLKEDERTRSIPVILVTAQRDTDNVVAAFEAGADDYVTKPYCEGELLARVRSSLDKREAFALVEQKARDMAALLEISQAVTSHQDTDQILQIVVDRIAENMELRRCSIARIDEKAGSGYVLASSDFPGIRGLRIDLSRYPEIREVIRTGKSVLVEDIKNHPLMAPIREHVSELDFNTVLVLPMTFHSEVIGTLMLRTAGEKKSFSEREIGFCQLVANVAANALKSAVLLEQARGESFDLRAAKEAMEKELRDKGTFQEIFEDAGEGILLMNALGEVVMANASARERLDFGDGTQPLKLSDFIAEESAMEAKENHINFFLGRKYRERSLLLFTTRDGRKRWMATALGRSRPQDSCAVLSFFDITELMAEHRRMEKEILLLRENVRGRQERISSAAGDLRDSASLIQGYCSLLKESEEMSMSETNLGYLQAVLKNSEHLSKMIDDLLELARP